MGGREKAGRFLCRCSSSLAWKPPSFLLAHPRPTTLPPHTSSLCLSRCRCHLERRPAGVAASLCCLRPPPRSMRSASRARQQHQHQHPQPRSRLGALPRAGSRPSPPARRPGARGSLPRRLRSLGPGSSPRSRRSERPRPPQGGEEHLGRFQVGGATGTSPRLRGGGSGRAGDTSRAGATASLSPAPRPPSPSPRALSLDPPPAGAPCAPSRRDRLRPQPPRAARPGSCPRCHRAAATRSYEP